MDPREDEVTTTTTTPRNVSTNVHQRNFERACVQVVVHLVQHMGVDPTWFTPPEDGDWLRTSLKEAARLARKAGDTERADKIEKILWAPIMYANKYHCPDCNSSWTDNYSAACDDECPECGTDVSPVESERLTSKPECTCCGGEHDDGA